MYLASTLTTSPDTATAVTFLAPKAYTPGGNDLVNTLQNEDVLTGNLNAAVTLNTVTSLTGDLGNPNDSGASVIAPTMTNVQTLNIAFTNTVSSGLVQTFSGQTLLGSEAQGLTLDFQDINGTTTANMTRISNNLRDSFVNLGNDVANLGIANTSENAKATITYLNNELDSAANAVTLTLNNASLASTQNEFDGNGAALKIESTLARGSDLQNQIETYNVVTAGTVGSTVATFKTGVSDFNDAVVGQRPVTVNIATGATASLAVGTLRWLGNRVETNSANAYNAFGTHTVGTNGLGFVDYSQIRTINVTGAAPVTLANVGTWESVADADIDIDFTLNATGLTGVLTADISNADGSIDSTFTGGTGSDRFYSAGGNVLAAVNGGAGTAVDTLTVQSATGATITLAAGSGNLDVLNLVQAANTVTPQAFAVNLVNYNGFAGITINNQSDTNQAMTVNVTNMSVATTEFSVRSTTLNTIGDPDTLVAGDVVINFTQAAGQVGGTLGLFLGDVDDRSVTDAFSFNNYTSNVSIFDLGTAGTTAAANLNLVVNTAGASGTGAANITVDYGDFQTLTTLSSEQTATNIVNIGSGAGTLDGTNSTYATPANSLNSTTYSGGTYTGNQNVVFGGVLANQAVAKLHNITTGSGVDSVDLSYMGTNATRTAQGAAISSYLLGTVVNMGTGTGDQLILSGTLADPRQVLNADITYDGYFANWTGVDVLTINNRNGMLVSPGTNTQALTTAYVGVDAYAQINNSGLNTFNFNDVSGELAVGFRFINNITIATDSTSAVATKWTTLNSFSSGNNTVNIDASVGISNGVGNLVQYTNTGANLANQVNLNYDNITNAGIDIDNATADELIVLNGGSLDIVDFDGDLGNVALTAAGNLTFVADDTYTASGVATIYDFTGVGNTIGTAIATLTMNAAAEVNALGLTIYGSTDGGSATAGVNNLITGGASVANTITSAGYRDVIDGGSAADSITYTGNAGVASNTVTITAGAGNDTVSVSNMTGTELATINAGAGNDVVTLSTTGGSTLYTFASGAPTVAITPGAATVSQTVLNVGSDTITNYVVTNGSFDLAKTIFGATNIGADNTAFANDHYAQVTSMTAVIGTLAGTDGLTGGGIVVVQSGSGANASIYYVDQAVTAGTVSVADLIQASHATLIGQVNNVTGDFGVGEFNVIA